MKNLIVFYDEQEKLTTELQDIPLPSDLKPHDVLIKVAVAASNPKDYKHPLPRYFNSKINQGDDCAGTIAAVGSAVRRFRVGERVAGFHQMGTLNGTYAEYAICPDQTVFRIPDTMSDEEAATIPLTVFTAAVGLYRNLDIPAPWDRSDSKAASTEKVPLVVNAASSSVGAFAIKLAKLSPKVGPIIAIAGSSANFVESLGVDAVVDYRSSSVEEDIKKAAAGIPIKHVFDASNSVASVTYLSSVLERDGRYTSTMPVGPDPAYNSDGPMGKILDAAGVWYENIWVGEVHETKKDGSQLFGAIISQTVEEALAKGQLRGHPYEIVPNGLNGVGEALEQLRDGKRPGNAKFVTRIAETAGIENKN